MNQSDDSNNAGTKLQIGDAMEKQQGADVAGASMLLKRDDQTAATATNASRGDDESRVLQTTTNCGSLSSESASSQDIRTCLLLQDVTVQCYPVHVEQLFRHFELKTMSNAEILFQLVYLVALEMGFAEQTAYKQYASQLNYHNMTTASFNAHNVRCLTQNKPIFTCELRQTKFSMQLHSVVSYQHWQSAEVDTGAICSILNAIVTGDWMIVTLRPRYQNASDDSMEGQCARSTCLTIPRYILGTMPAGQRPRLLKLNELVIKLRDELFTAVRNEQLGLLGFAVHPSLLGLPPEIYDNIFHYLSPNQLRIVANVNKRLNQYAIGSKHYKRPVRNRRLPGIANVRTHFY